MATGTPVIAYGKWGALETVTQDTGVFFQEQNSESLNAAIDRFETLAFDAKKIREHALSFDISQFQKSLIQCIQKNIP
jgi:glycosyltransferase involved in cell wall biosynthesis